MTGFARTEGSVDGIAWTWELRSVNGRDSGPAVPPACRMGQPGDQWRELAGRRLKRGNVTANLSVKRQTESRLELDPAALEQVLEIVTDLQRRIPGGPPPSAEALLSLPGVLRQAHADQQEERRLAGADVQAGFVAALAQLVESRHAEGDRLAVVLARLLDEIASMRDQAAAEAVSQPATQRARMLENLHTLLRDTPNLPEERIAQEVALLASRSDVSEELDRLSSHIVAAHDLLGRQSMSVASLIS